MKQRKTMAIPRRGDLGAGDLSGPGRGGSDVGVRLRGAGGAHWKDPWHDEMMMMMMMLMMGW